MRQLLRSSFVIGRRDFTATVFSKTFIFFLLGPLFPVFLGILFGGIGARVALQAEQPRVAVIATEADFKKLNAAREQLSAAMGERPVVELIHVEPGPNPVRQSRDLLQSGDRLAVAVLTGGIERPHLTGAIDPNGTVAGQVGALVAAARAPPGDAQPLVVTPTERSSGSVTRSRALTAQSGQLVLFLLIMILATMTLSQLIEEKSNKIIEVLAAAVPIQAIFFGKLFAMLAASLVGIIVWVAVGAAAIAILTTGGVGALPEPAIGWTAFLALCVIYFAMNYLLLGSVFLSIGAQASTAREVQILSMPATLAQVLIFGFAALAVGSPYSGIALAAAIFPLSSPLVMVARAAELPELWPHLLAIGWQALWVGLIVVLSARLFRRTVLKSGPAPRRWWRRSAA